ncbi:uncharacterized protein LOC117106195 [Anneissia japonica]|uniref:uncharacterized protein LOC117106195 n=1 Tax=Anneissia japonica TaxID=1529436 RepID=UPI001425AEB5|nr:uncharacterized protein LOC117106195 [Anneissia japonica]
MNQMIQIIFIHRKMNKPSDLASESSNSQSDSGDEAGPIIGDEAEANIGNEVVLNVGNETKSHIQDEAGPNVGDRANPNIGDEAGLNVGDKAEPNIGDEAGPNVGYAARENDGAKENIGGVVQPNRGNGEEKRRSRKRQRNEFEWKQNVLKWARNKGLEYTTRKGKVVQARKIIYHRCGRCVNKCNIVLSDDDRDTIFRNYWIMGDRQRQRDYIANHVCVKKNSRKTPGSRRNMTLHYYFTVRDKRVKVCKAVFLKTLCIGEKTVTYTISHRSETGQSAKDGRCSKPPGIKKPDLLRDTVKSHINSFPALASHYARSGTTGKYLDHNLNIRKMHSLYMENYEGDRTKQVKESYYRSVFVSEFNLFFHKPKKDKCSFCVSYENSSHEEKQAQQADYDAHHQRKNRVRQLKLEFKELSKSDNAVVSLTFRFDLEQVLLSPKMNVSALFYRRKLATYNLTTYDLDSHNVNCFMWHEGVGERGSSEIATCMYQYLKSLPAKVTRVIFFSDTCSGQNRNQYFSSMCLNVVRYT